ncbi:MAG: hypothetical protein H0W76_24910 [Pyrinomonadaceae bacterium]|nr:hypothetical protein [Pyrinomonadaceae bacterium]
MRTSDVSNDNKTGIADIHKYVPPPAPKVDTANVADNSAKVGAATKVGDLKLVGSFRKFQLFSFEIGAANAAGPSNQITPNPQSATDGKNDAQRIKDALALGDRNVFQKIFSGKDASEELGKALTDVRGRVHDPEYAAALLNELGPEQAAKLEKMLHDDNDFSGVMKEAISSASRTGKLSPEFQRDLVNHMDLGALVRLTDSLSTLLMGKDFLVAAGKKAVQEGVGWEKSYITPPGGYSTTVLTEAKPEADRLLQNIAAADPRAANELLQDPKFVADALKFTNVLAGGRKEDKGVAELIKKGTSSPPNSAADVEAALRSIGDVLKDPGKLKDETGIIHIFGKTELGEDKAVSNNVAQSLAEAFQYNSSLFAQGATRETSGAATFDRDDVRNIMSAIVQHPEQRTRMSLTVQAEAAKLFAEGSQYGAPAGQREASSVRAGNLIGTYADAYSRVVLGEAANKDKRDAIVASLTAGAIQALPSFIPNPVGAGAGAVVGNTVGVFVQNALQGNAVDNAKQALDQGNQRSQGAIEAGVLSAYYLNAQRAYDSNPNAKRFVDAVKSYNDSLAPNERILNADGSLKDISKLDPNKSPDAQIIENINELVTPSERGTPRVVIEQIDPMIARVFLAADVARR